MLYIPSLIPVLLWNFFSSRFGGHSLLILPCCSSAHHNSMHTVTCVCLCLQAMRFMFISCSSGSTLTGHSSPALPIYYILWVCVHRPHRCQGAFSAVVFQAVSCTAQWQGRLPCLGIRICVPSGEWQWWPLKAGIPATKGAIVVSLCYMDNIMSLKINGDPVPQLLNTKLSQLALNMWNNGSEVWLFIWATFFFLFFFKFYEWM